MNPVEQDMREAFVEIRGWDGQSYYGEEGHLDIYECHCCNCTIYVDWQAKGAALGAYPLTDTKWIEDA
jgi:hypothetical protein